MERGAKIEVRDGVGAVSPKGTIIFVTPLFSQRPGPKMETKTNSNTKTHPKTNANTKTHPKNKLCHFWLRVPVNLC